MAIISGPKIIVQSLLRSIAASIVMTLIIAAILSGFICKGIITMDIWGYGVMGMLTVASYAGCWFGCRKVTTGKLPVSMICGIGYYLMLIMTGAVFYGGTGNGAVETALMILCGIFLYIILDRNIKKSRKRHPYRKIRNR